jgi:hypothetical protein
MGLCPRVPSPSTRSADRSCGSAYGTLAAEDFDAVKADEKCWDSRHRDVLLCAAAWAERLLERLVRRVAAPAEAAPAAAGAAQASDGALGVRPGAAEGVSSDATMAGVSADATMAAKRRLPELGMLILGKCPGAPELQTLLAAMQMLNAAEQMRDGLAVISAAQYDTAKEKRKSLCKSGVDLLLLSQKHVPGPSCPDVLTAMASWSFADASDVIKRCAAKIEEGVASRDAVLASHRTQTCMAARVALTQKVDELRAVGVDSWKTPL